MSVETKEIVITTDASGDYSQEHQCYTGYLEELLVNVGGLAATTDLTITDKITGRTIFSQANIAANVVSAPRQLEHLNADGTALTTHTRIVISGPIIVTVAQGGNAVSGTLRLRIAE